MFTSTIFVIIFFYTYIITVLGLKINGKDAEAKIAITLLVEMGIELVYEVGKACIFGTVIGGFFDEEKMVKDYIKALNYGTILYPLGFILDRLYGKGKK